MKKRDAYSARLPSGESSSGNEVWDDLGSDPTEAKRRTGKIAEKCISLFL